MKVSISNDGTLTIEAENGLEQYALKNWIAWYGGPENTSPSTLKVCNPATHYNSSWPINAAISIEGELTLTACSRTEAYALDTWYREYQGGKAFFKVGGLP